MASFVVGRSQNIQSLEDQLARRPEPVDTAPHSAHTLPRNSPTASVDDDSDSESDSSGSGHLALTRTVTSYDLQPDDAPKKKKHSEKMGTFAGVFMPVSFNMYVVFLLFIGIIMFLRFGFILGQTGLLGALLLLALGYLIDVFTATSVSAIATNGQVRGGGPYYMLSRSLGPEFGGSIGICFIVALALNVSLNVLGFVESLLDVFGKNSENNYGVLPDSPWWLFFYGSLLLAICAMINLIGTKVFNKATNLVAIIVTISVISIPISFLFKAPFEDPTRTVYYTGPSLQTLFDNLLPRFTKNAAGSSASKKDSYMTVFGVLFPALNGILSGASMSASLRKPGKSISKGTFWALLVTAIVYVSVLFMMAASTSRVTFYENLGVLQDISLAPSLVITGALASTFFSAMLGINACAQIMQAVARDDLIPILKVFAYGSEGADNPIYGIIFVWVVGQLTLFADNVNVIASLVTMFTMLVFSTINLACFVLRIAASQNFRPEFRWFSEWTALAGLVLSIVGMAVTDPAGASAALLTSIALFVVIHYTSPPKSWGDVTQSLIYHQVRKYLLRLDERKNNVKFWRPALLVLTNNTRRDMNMILAMNSLKKGGLFILGHVIKGDFYELLPVLKRQQLSWLDLVDLSHIKAFVDMTVAADERVGARSLMLNAGLGSMRPNIVVIGFLDSFDWRKASSYKYGSDDREPISTPASRLAGPLYDSADPLPTDDDRTETPITIQDYVGILEDSLALNKALAIAYRFQDLELPQSSKRPRASSSAGDDDKEPSSSQEKKQKWIDLWPLLSSDDGWSTYTMVLQLGTTLSYVPSWSHHKLRVTIFVEYPDEIAEEKRKMEILMSNLRIPATLRIVVLASGNINTYEILVRGKEGHDERIELALVNPGTEEVKRQLNKAHGRSSPSDSHPESVSSSYGFLKKKLGALDKYQPHVTFGGNTGEGGVDLNKVINLLSRSTARGAVRSMSISYHPEAVTELPTPAGSDVDEDEGDESDLDESGFPKERKSTFGSITKNLSNRIGNYRRKYSSFIGENNDSKSRQPLLPTTSASTSGRTSRDELVGGQSSTSALKDYGGTEAFKTVLPRRTASQGTFGISATATNVDSQTLKTPTKNDRFRNGDSSSLHSTPMGMDTIKEGKRNSHKKTKRNASSKFDDDTDEGLGGSKRDNHGQAASDLDTNDISQATVTPYLVDNDQNSTKGGEGTPRHDRKEKKTSNEDTSSSTNTLPHSINSFNDLPYRAQMVILNELFSYHSGPETAVILTSLPAPEHGASASFEKSASYLEHLGAFFHGLPPVLAVYSSQQTMTTAL